MMYRYMTVFLCIFSVVWTDKIESQEVRIGSVLDELRVHVKRQAAENEYVNYLRNLTATLKSHSSPPDPALVEAVETHFKRFLVYHGVFAMYFRDLNGVIFPYPDEGTGEDALFRRLINRHGIEDREHFKFIMRDWKTMKLDKFIDPTKFLPFWYGDLMKEARLFAYRLIEIDARVDGKNDPVARYIFIETIEMAASEVFGVLSNLYREWIAQRRVLKGDDDGFELLYVADTHSDREIGDLYIAKTENEQLQRVMIKKEKGDRLVAIISGIVDALDAFRSGGLVWASTDFEKQTLFDL